MGRWCFGSEYQNINRFYDNFTNFLSAKNSFTFSINFTFSAFPLFPDFQVSLSLFWNRYISKLKSSSLASICRDDARSHRRSLGLFSQANRHWHQTAHIYRNRQCSLCVSAHGQALHAADHYQSQQYTRGLGNFKTLFSSGKLLNVHF